MAWRVLEEQVFHDKVVAALKKTLFKYPNDKHPQLKSIANHPIKSHSITDHMGGNFYPDIVVLDGRNERIVSAVEVETENTINENEAIQWVKFASLSENFYLFFPRGFEEIIKKFCLNIKNVHCYHYWQDGEHFQTELIKF
jgi:hypothetical protein